MKSKQSLDELKYFQKLFDQKYAGNTEFYELIHNDNIEALEHLLVCVLGELGEFANIVKKIKRGDFSLDDVRCDLNEEFADVFAYILKISNQLNIDIEAEYLSKMKKNEMKFEKFLK